MLKNATMSFNISAYLKNIELEPENFVKLYVITAEAENKN